MKKQILQMISQILSDVGTRSSSSWAVVVGVLEAADAEDEGELLTKG